MLLSSPRLLSWCFWGHVCINVCAADRDLCRCLWLVVPHGGNRDHLCWNPRAMLCSPTPNCSKDSWPCLSLETIEGELTPPHHGKGVMPMTLERNGPTPHQRHEKAVADGMGLGDLALPLTWLGCHRLISSATIQIHILNLGMAHPNIYPVYGLLKCVKGLVLWKNIHNISRAWGNRSISKRSFSVGPVMIGCQTNDSLQWTFRGWNTIAPNVTIMNRGIWKTEKQVEFWLFICLIVLF